MPNVDNVTARQIMHSPAVVVSPDQSLESLHELLIDSQISGAPVVENGRLVGVISRSDLVRIQVLMKALDGQVSDAVEAIDLQSDAFRHPVHEAFQGFRASLGRFTVRDAMREQVFSCAPDDLVSAVAAQMIRRHVHRIIVVENDHPLGVVSSLDIVKLVAGE